MDCCIKTALIFSNITNASVHSLRSLGQVYGRISRCSKAAPINSPSMRGVILALSIREHSTQMKERQPFVVLILTITFGVFIRIVIGETSLDMAGAILSSLFAFGLLSYLLYSFETSKVFGSFGVLYKHESVILFSALQTTYGTLGVLFATLPHNFGIAG